MIRLLEIGRTRYIGLFCLAISLFFPTLARSNDVDENGIEDSNEQALADRFCPTLVLHGDDAGVAPEPVEMVTHRLFRTMRSAANSAYQGQGFVPWNEVTNYNYSHVTGWMWSPFNHEVLYCQQSDGPAWGLYHFDYAGPGAVCELESGELFDQPAGWYEAYSGGRMWRSPDQSLEAYYPPGADFPTTTYAHMFRHPNQSEWVIQYWFFYPFNDWIGDHEGDWEHINVVINSNNPASAVVDSVVYFFHEKYKTCYPVQTQNPNGVFECFIVDETHPVIFVGGHGETDGDGGSGEGSHGSYPVWGKWEHVVLGSEYGFQFVDYDEVIGGDGLYIPWHTIVDGEGSDRDGVVVIKNPNQYNYATNPEMSWLKANVAWGHPFVASHGSHNLLADFLDAPLGNEPPLGPAHQPTWNNPTWNSQHEYISLATDFPHASDAEWSPPPPTSITEPDQNDPVSGLLSLRGTIHYADDVVLQWGEGASPSTWHTLGMKVRQWPLANTEIGTWNTGVVPAGTYTIRLRVYHDETPTDITRTVTVSHRRIEVATSGGDFSTIQAAVDFAERGDTIRVVMSGSAYYGSITMKESVHLIATGGPVRDVFGSANLPTIIVKDHEYPCVIDGFTFRHDHWNPGVPGSATEHGAKITNSDPVFRNCEFKANVADYGGGVLVTAPSRPRFENCKFSGNRANVDGGGIAYRDPAGIVTSSGRLFCSGCTFVANLAAADNAGSAVSMSASLTSLTEFSNCTFTEHDIYATSNYDETTVFLRGEPEPRFVNCTFSDNGTSDLIRMIDCYPPLFDKCTFAHNTGVDGVLGWLTTPSGVKVYRSIVAFNSGPLAVGDSDLQYTVDLQKSILFSNVDQGRGPSDGFWAGVGQTSYGLDPAFCSNQPSFDLRLYAFSPAAAPAPPNLGYFGERVGAHDVGCVPPADVTVTALPAPKFAGKPWIVVACPAGDLDKLQVTVDLNGPITRNIDWREIVLDADGLDASAVDTATVFDQSGFVEAQADAVGPGYVATIEHAHFGGHGDDTVNVLLNGHPLASQAHFEIRSVDMTGDGQVNVSDFGVFGGSSGYPSPPKPYSRYCDFSVPEYILQLQDFAMFSAHWGHAKPAGSQQLNDEPAESNAGVALQFTEEFPTANTHRLYVDVSVEHFADVTASIFSMQAGSERLSFVNWIPAGGAIGEAMFSPVIRDGAEELSFGVLVSEAFAGTEATLGRLVFDVSGSESMEIGEDNFVLTIGEVLVDAPASGLVVASMEGVFARTFDPAVARVYHNHLEQNFPNPFNPTTTIVFSMKTAGNVNVAIYDVAGRRVRELVNERRERGVHRVDWDGRNDAGQMVASGVYLYKLTAGSFTDTKKMTLLK